MQHGHLDDHLERRTFHFLNPRNAVLGSIHFVSMQATAARIMVTTSEMLTIWRELERTG
jgi:hypothetical protein